MSINRIIQAPTEKFFGVGGKQKSVYFKFGSATGLERTNTVVIYITNSTGLLSEVRNREITLNLTGVFDAVLGEYVFEVDIAQILQDYFENALTDLQPFRNASKIAKLLKNRIANFQIGNGTIGVISDIYTFCNASVPLYFENELLHTAKRSVFNSGKYILLDNVLSLVPIPKRFLTAFERNRYYYINELNYQGIRVPLCFAIKCSQIADILDNVSSANGINNRLVISLRGTAIVAPARYVNFEQGFTTPETQDVFFIDLFLRQNEIQDFITATKVYSVPLIIDVSLYGRVTTIPLLMFSQKGLLLEEIQCKTVVLQWQNEIIGFDTWAFGGESELSTKVSNSQTFLPRYSTQNVVVSKEVNDKLLIRSSNISKEDSEVLKQSLLLSKEVYIYDHSDNYLRYRVINIGAGNEDATNNKFGKRIPVVIDTDSTLIYETSKNKFTFELTLLLPQIQNTILNYNEILIEETPPIDPES